MGMRLTSLCPMRPRQICHCHVWSVGLIDFLIVWNNPKKLDHSRVAVVLLEEWSVRNCRLIVLIFCAPSAFGSVGVPSTRRVYQDFGWSVGSRILSRVGCWMLQSLKSDLGRGRCRSAWTGKTHLEARLLRLHEWLEVCPDIENILTTLNSIPLLPFTAHFASEGIANKSLKGLAMIKSS